MPSLFRRRTTTAAVDGAATTATASGGPTPEQPATSGADSPAPAGEAATRRSRRGTTPSKRELGKITPKRPSPHVRRPGAPPPSSRRGLTKEERQELRRLRRERRREIAEGMRRGDPRYLSARDQGPVRALVRDVVDSRRTTGTWFFAGALVIVIAASTPIAEVILAANALFIVLVTAVVVDLVALCRRVGRLVRERHPDTTEKRSSLYFYAVMRAMSFRRARIPQPRVSVGDPV
ncbi:MAG TPA: DUF3043 domain-containing protein [Natronosporangium sp.]|nr:DUF3043 domain-containing protein [Natronosporangium sp.]